MSDILEFHDQNALLYRLSDALRKKPREVVFLLGSPLAAPSDATGPGVPLVPGVIGLIEREFNGDSEQLRQLSEAREKSANPYQAAFKFLIGRRGQDVANDIVQQAVLKARLNQDELPGVPLSDEQCRALEADNSGWYVAPGLAAVGTLIADFPQAFGGKLITTNFDPSIQVSITRAGGKSWRTTLHGDGNLSQTEAEGCHVIHLHGYWWGSDTLHTVRQLTQPRPRLNASLAEILRSKLLVVSGYGGWDDVFTRAIFDVVRDDTAAPELLWLFRSTRPTLTTFLQDQLAVGIDRGRISLYENIDCNAFFPLLAESWSDSGVSPVPKSIERSNPVVIPAALQKEIAARQDETRQIEGDTEDRPPEFSVCVGREEELATLEKTTSRVIFITGIGGQGKSTLAAQYFQNYRASHPSHLLIWRDCKETGETFENQIISAIESLTKGRITGSELSKQDAESIIDVLVGLLAKTNVLFVFDNVDNFVSLDERRLTASGDMLVRKVLGSSTSSQFVFTCRPAIDYADPGLLSLHLQGITLDAAIQLFAFRNGIASAEEIKAAHEFTSGHSLWLDLLALQTRKIGQTDSLSSLLTQIGNLPENTLENIYQRLTDNERLVLQVLAETVKPSSMNEVGDYLNGWMNFNKANKAVRALKAQNLVVVKELRNKSEVLELHPLIRQFVRTKFPLSQRRSFIRAIIKVYNDFISHHVDSLGSHTSLTVLQNWTQKAELETETGDLTQACATLAQAARAFSTSAFAREFTRTTRVLLNSFDWTTHHSEIKDFDYVFRHHIEFLTYLGEADEINELLEKFQLTVPERDSRYITYCEMKCFVKWVRKEFADAVKWGKMGIALLDKSGVDTTSNIRHRLALAQRDAGNPEIALEFFSKGAVLSEVVDPDELVESRGAAFYGNIGRCFHFMGQVQQALVCYQKSAILLERDSAYEQVLNQGYVRWWLAELLLARGQRELATNFAEAARLKWEDGAPALAKGLVSWKESVGAAFSSVENAPEEIELVCQRWIMGEYLDSE